MFQSPFQLPERFQSLGGVVRTCRKTLPWRISAVQVPWMSVWARLGASCSRTKTATNAKRIRNIGSSGHLPWTEGPGRRLKRSDGGDLGFAGHPELPADPVLDRLVDVGVLLQELLGVFAALTQAFTAVGEPGAGLFDDPLVNGEIEEVPCARDAFAVHDVELGLAKRR